MYKWIYRLSDGVFTEGGAYDPSPSPSTHGLVVLTRHPDRRTERYDGSGGIRPATSQEIADYDAAQVAGPALGRFNGEKLVKAVAIWTAGKLNVPLATARAEILAILKTL